MGWVVTIGEASLREDELTAGEWELLVGLAVTITPHSELEVRPSHCPACRNAAGIVALVTNGMDLTTARARVGAMPRFALLDAVSFEAEEVPV